MAGRSIDSQQCIPSWDHSFPADFESLLGQHQQPKGQQLKARTAAPPGRLKILSTGISCSVQYPCTKGPVLVNSAFISREGCASTKFQVNKGICRERMEAAKTKISLGSCEVSDLERTESWVFPGGLLTRPSSPSQPVAMVLNQPYKGAFLGKSQRLSGGVSIQCGVCIYKVFSRKTFWIFLYCAW